MSARSTAFAFAVLAIALTLTQDVFPARDWYHSWQYTTIVAIAIGVMFVHAFRSWRGKAGANGKRVALALAGATLDSAVYRCAVSVAGISDLARMLKTVNILAGDTQDSGAQQYWDRYLGVSGAGDPAVKTISPIEHIDSVTAPILLIHGKDDTVVRYEQSELMADALKKAGKPVQFVTLKQEDHWLSRGATRLEMLEATVAFLKANNPPD